MKRTSQNHIVVPRRTPRRFYGHGIPNVELDRLAGQLIVVEGADGSGRSTQIAHAGRMARRQRPRHRAGRA